MWQQQVLVSVHYKCKPWQAQRRSWDHIRWVAITLIVRANFQIQQKVFTLKKDGKLSTKRKCIEEHWYNKGMYRLLCHPHNQSEHLHSSYCLSNCMQRQFCLQPLPREMKWESKNTRSSVLKCDSVWLCRTATTPQYVSQHPVSLQWVNDIALTNKHHLLLITINQLQRFTQQ